MRFILLSTFLLCWGFELSAQQKKSITIKLSERSEDEQFKKSMAIVPVYKYTSSFIEPYIMFGVDPPEDLKDLEVKRLPDMTGMKDTAYSFIYFSGADNAVNQGYILTIIGNYRRSTRTIYFFVDRNNNFDFTDDGGPDSMIYHDRELVIHLSNQIVPEAKYQVKLSRLEYGENVAYKNLLTEHYKKHSGKKQFTEINYCFREQRYNSLAANFVSGEDSFRIALKDLNTNGIFNESCVDKIFLGPYGKQVTTEEMQFILPNIKYTTFEWNKKLYRVKSVAADGGEIQLEQVSGATMNRQLKTGKKIPKFSYKTTSSKKENIRDHKGKMLYIFFWDKTRLSAEDTLYLGKIQREFPGKAAVIALNHGDAPKSVYLVQYYDKLIFPIGFSTGKIADKMFLQEVPRGYLVNKRQKLVSDQITPKAAFEWMQKEIQ